MREFNLIEENWIRVRNSECALVEVSLKDALLNAHNYVSLAGEIPTQDTAVLRLLVAVVYAVFYREDLGGNAAPIEKPGDALRRWRSLWENSKFPEGPITDYLDKWKDRFWLFDDKRPFWQALNAKIGTEYTAAKLNGEISESNNKIRLFPTRTGENKEKITYSEAARWLLYVNAYDDTSAKAKGKNLPSPGAGWLGKLGLISAEGDNLFETIMLNLTFLKNGQAMWEGNCEPIWELEKPRTDERVEIALPDDLASLYTLQSRRLLLISNDGMVTGYYLLGGDFFAKSNALSEQMTMWRKTLDKKSGIATYTPQRHDPSRKIWREFPAIAAPEEGDVNPGVVSWIGVLKKNKLLDKNRMVRFRITSVQYGDKDFFITDAYTDAMTFHTDLLTELGRKWINKIKDEIKNCDYAAYNLGKMSKDLTIAAGGSEGDAEPEISKAK